MSVKIIYKEIPIGAAEGAEVTAQGQTQGSVLALLPFGNDDRKEYATGEHNMWVLNGTKAVYNGEQYAFWSEALSDDECYFNNPPEITLTLDNYYGSAGVDVDFGTSSFCYEIELLWYRDGELISQKTFYPNELKYYCENKVENYNKITLRMLRTAFPRTRARVNGIYFGMARTFYRDQLRSVKMTQQINLVSTELPENVLDWQLNSAERVEYLFQFKQPVEAYDNDKLLGAFYIKSSDRKGARLYAIKCTDAIGVLDEEAFPDAYHEGKNALELAEEICTGFPVIMGEQLKNKTVSGVIRGCTRRQALQQLCFAIGAVADTSGVQGIKIFTPPSANPREISKNRVRVGGAVKKSDLVTEVQLAAHSFTTTGEGESYEINGVTYYDTPVIHSKINPNASEADKKNVISITDATLISADNVSEILDRVYNYHMMRNVHKVSFRLENEQVGDYVSTPTNWGEWVTGHYTRATVTLSGIAVAAAEVIGI